MVLSRLRHLCLNIILVKVVTFEKLLHAISAKLCFTFFNGFGVLPLLVVYMICVEVVNVYVRYVLRLHAAVSQNLPVKVVEPWMLFQLDCTFHVTYAIHRFPL